MKISLILLLLLSLCIPQEESYLDSSKIRDPNIAWKLSVVPGMGQVYNGKYIKAIGFAVSETYAISQFVSLKEEGRIGLRNTYAWWVVGLFAWNVIDAYVDAHLSTFPINKLKSSALPDSIQKENY